MHIGKTSVRFIISRCNGFGRQIITDTKYGYSHRLVHQVMKETSTLLLGGCEVECQCSSILIFYRNSLSSQYLLFDFIYQCTFYVYFKVYDIKLELNNRYLTMYFTQATVLIRNFCKAHTIQLTAFWRRIAIQHENWNPNGCNRVYTN